MRKFFTLTNIICVGVVGFAAASIIYVNVTNINFSSTPEDEAAPVVEVQTGNPLLKATKDDVAGWFPGTCFAEIYMQNPSYNGGLVAASTKPRRRSRPKPELP